MSLVIKDPLTKKEIKVNNLDKSIIQADEFRNYQVYSKYEKERKQYWEELYKRLLTLKSLNIEVEYEEVKPF
jgi:hypothetical protein